MDGKIIGDSTIEDYADADRRPGYMEFFNKQNGQQSGDPNKLAKALLMITSEGQPPRRFIAGADAIGIAEQKISNLQAQIDAYRDFSFSIAYED